MIQDNLIFTFSGIRGIVDKGLNFEIAKKLGIAFGAWYPYSKRQLILGKDTRPSSTILEKGIIEGLLYHNFDIINVGICPTPIIIHTKNRLNIPSGIIITGSHNNEEWNGVKLIAKKSFLGDEAISEIANNLKRINLSAYSVTNDHIPSKITNLNPIQDYLHTLYQHIDYEKIKKQNTLRVVVDTGAGAGKYATPQLLQDLGCKVKTINNDLYVNKRFPRAIEPVKKNLTDLIMEVWQGNYDIGFAHDSDADRLAIIGENGICYPEDVGLALITEHFLKNHAQDSDEIIFITNLASSLMFEVLAERYGAEIVRTPIGEKFLIEEISVFMNKKRESPKSCLILGGEGSCGGAIFPDFNLTRDAIFAVAKIVEILIDTNQKISKLVKQLPKYYSYRSSIPIKSYEINNIIKETKKHLIQEGENVNQINNDLRFGKGKEWFVLIHPSNTEPIIRIISEARIDSSARLYCEATTELIKLVISGL
jgi:phosphomannomutase